jgi:hypothetical protein
MTQRNHTMDFCECSTTHSMSGKAAISVRANTIQRQFGGGNGW